MDTETLAIVFYTAIACIAAGVLVFLDYENSPEEDEDQAAGEIPDRDWRAYETPAWYRKRREGGRAQPAFLAAILVAAAVGLLSGCAAPSGALQPSGTVFERSEHLREGRVIEGVVLSVRPVQVAVSPQERGTVTGAGAAIGAIAGIAIGGSDAGARAALGILGALAGGTVANAASQETGVRKAHEIVVRTEDGRRIMVVQQGATPVVGAKVWVTGLGRNTRVVPQ